jgi:mediator of RNA polymerase II transcription subunit 16
MYQNMDGKWAEVPAELKNTGYSDRLLTHAAMVATQGWPHTVSPDLDME